MKIKVRKLSNVLKNLHKRFLENERQQAEQYFERKIAPFEFVVMLTQDKNFRWLTPFSTLIAEIDAFADENEEIMENDLISIKNQIDFLLKDESSSVANRYNHHLNTDAAFIMLHSELKKELNQFIVAA